jgi:hypothetical protein
MGTKLPCGPHSEGLIPKHQNQESRDYWAGSHTYNEHQFQFLRDPLPPLGRRQSRKRILKDVASNSPAHQIWGNKTTPIPSVFGEGDISPTNANLFHLDFLEVRSAGTLLRRSARIPLAFRSTWRPSCMLSPCVCPSSSPPHTCGGDELGVSVSMSLTS